MTAAPASTASRGTRILGGLTLVLVVAQVALGLFISPRDTDQGDQIRLMYVHVPAAITMYVAIFALAAGSIGWLWKRSRWWDLVATSAAELATAFVAIVLVTGSLWGRHTWGTYWDWDPRLTSTALLLLLLLGYLAVRRLPADPDSRNTRSAVVGLLAFADIPIVHYAVDWWRSLHQTATISTLSPTIGGLQLLSLMTGMVSFVVLFLWLLLHRFRVAWLEEQVEDQWLAEALAERRTEAEVG